MRLRVFLVLSLVQLFLAVPITAQTVKGVQFQEGLSWQQMKSKAVTEHKYIFVDCYASWCGPCKMMDQNIYPVDSIGDLVNQRFIAVKMQLDSSRSDNEEVKAHYTDAHEIMMDYIIRAYPTFLFFSPDGKLVHRGVGYKDTVHFVSLCKDALDPSKQYYTLLKDYNAGKSTGQKILLLLDMARLLREDDAFKKISEDYAKNYLPALSGSELYSKDNLLFFGNNLRLFSSGDKLFTYILHHSFETDSMVDNPFFSGKVIAMIIYTEEIFKKLWKDPQAGLPFTSDPDWAQIKANIRNKYGYDEKYIDSLISPVQINFYAVVKNWSEFAHCVQAAMFKYPPTLISKGFTVAMGGPSIFFRNDAGALNESAWTLFWGCNDKTILKKALEWSDRSLTIAPENDLMLDVPQYYDTKANLLYKLGRPKESIGCEKQAIEAAEQKLGSPLFKLAADDIKQFQETIEKMQKGMPTWPAHL